MENYFLTQLMQVYSYSCEIKEFRRNVNSNKNEIITFGKITNVNCLIITFILYNSNISGPRFSTWATNINNKVFPNMKLGNYLCLSILNRTWHKFNSISQTNCRLWTNFAAYVIERWLVWDVCLIFNDFYFYWKRYSVILTTSFYDMNQKM